MRFWFYLILISLPSLTFSQSIDSSINSLQNLPSKYFSKIETKVTSLDDQLTKKSLKYLAKFEKQQKKLQAKLLKLHPELAANFLSNTKEKYDQLTAQLKTKASKVSKLVGGEYIPYVDSLSTSLSFLKQFSSLSDKVKNPLSDLQGLQSKLQQAEKIKQYIHEQQSHFKDILSKYTHLPAGIKKGFQNLNKTRYYYTAQVQEYKDMLKDPSKVEVKALTLLNKVPVFQKFMKENNQLATLFRLPTDYGSIGSQSISGLQTRASVQSLIQQQISIGGPNAQAQIKQNLAEAHSEINKLKDQINKAANGNSDPEMPNFVPNSSKTKSFLKRIEYGTNIQFSKSNVAYGSSADIAFTLGYKLNENKSIVGIGAAYKMGMGNLQHISITHQGLGFRSYLDYKIKNQFYATGGYEMNYNAQFKNIEALKNSSAWQKSSLMGLAKKYKISKKVKGEMKLLYDFMGYTHVPVSQPILFRLGYIIK